MNLVEIRHMFRDLSGRYDLVDDEGDNSTVDLYINSACRYLDRLAETQKSFATHYKFISTGGWNVQFPYCRAVKEIWVASKTARWQLEKKDLQDLLAEILTEKVSLLDTGAALYYAPVLTQVVGPVPIEINNYIDTLTVSSQLYNAALILPPTNEKILIEVKGLFYSTPLVNNKDENFWTIVHPNTLLKAALRELEIFNQNSSKVADWEKSIVLDIDGVNKDLVDEHIAEIDEMEG